jgi:hypothetical protein
LLFTVALLFFSCGKDNSVSENDIPEWLKVKIEQDEKVIKTEPKLMQNYGAWYSYEFNGEIYYEYDNLLSSESRNPYSKEGFRVNVSEAPFIDYWNQKCCEKLVWKAPDYQKL